MASDLLKYVNFDKQSLWGERNAYSIRKSFMGLRMKM